MTLLLGLLSVVLFGLVALQVGKVTELASSLRDEREVQQERNDFDGKLGLVFLVGFLSYQCGLGVEAEQQRKWELSKLTGRVRSGFS